MCFEIKTDTLVSVFCVYYVFRLPETEYQKIAIDDVHLCSDKQAMELFTLFNNFRNRKTRMIFTANVPPQELPFANDIKTRMAWGSVYEICALSDEAKTSVLKQLAQNKQMNIDDSIFAYLFNYVSRDLSKLIVLLTEFDIYAVKNARKMTLPLLQQFLKDLI